MKLYDTFLCCVISIGPLEKKNVVGRWGLRKSGTGYFIFEISFEDESDPS